MTIEVISEVGGHTMTLMVNGARLQMDLITAGLVAQRINQSLDFLYADQVAAHQQDALYRKINSHDPLRHA